MNPLFQIISTPHLPHLHEFCATLVSKRVNPAMLHSGINPDIVVLLSFALDNDRMAFLLEREKNWKWKLFLRLGWAPVSAEWPLFILKAPSPQVIIIIIILRSKLFLLFIGREPTTWPANNCVQIMVCSCAMLSNCVWLQIIFCSCVKETVLFFFLRSLLRENCRSLRFPRIFVKKTNSVIEW